MEPTETRGDPTRSSSRPPSNGSEQAGHGRLDLEHPDLYFNRELSWLDFNDRVLQLAEDDSVPLLERIKFCAIWESNLDEFFMVRVANLEDKLRGGPGRAGRRRHDR